MVFGERIKELRNKKNLTQEELAEKLNISRVAVSKWETGKGYPDIENLIILSEIFDVTLDELIKNDTKVQEKVVKDSKIKNWVIAISVAILYLLISSIFNAWIYSWVIWIIYSIYRFVIK